MSKYRDERNYYEDWLVGTVSKSLSSETPYERLNRHLRLRSQLTQSEINIINKYR